MCWTLISFVPAVDRLDVRMGELSNHELVNNDLMYLLENAPFLFDYDDDVAVLLDRCYSELVRLHRVASNGKELLYTPEVDRYIAKLQ